jgi:hypothetical protein
VRTDDEDRSAADAMAEKTEEPFWVKGATFLIEKIPGVFW